MSESGGFSEESARREMAGRAKNRAKEMRTQAELAWARVQRSIPRSGPPELSVDDLLNAADRVPNEGYIAGIAASLTASAWLYALGRHTASAYVGTIPSLIFGLGLYARFIRRSARHA